MGVSKCSIQTISTSNVQYLMVSTQLNVGVTSVKVGTYSQFDILLMEGTTVGV